MVGWLQQVENFHYERHHTTVMQRLSTSSCRWPTANLFTTDYWIILRKVRKNFIYNQYCNWIKYNGIDCCNKGNNFCARYCRESNLLLTAWNSFTWFTRNSQYNDFIEFIRSDRTQNHTKNMVKLISIHPRDQCHFQQLIQFQKVVSCFFFNLAPIDSGNCDET